jgi:hypothetical protein
MFPKYRGPSLIGREHSFHGHVDDAQIMDAVLFRKLKPGFSEEVKYTLLWMRPNVIFTNDPDDDFEWPTTIKEAAKFWVVVIDYHE